MRIYKSEKLRKAGVIYPELSYKIVGCAYDVHNELGGGRKEKHYQVAMFSALRNLGLETRQQVYYKIQYKGELVGKDYFDFLVGDKVIVEIKSGYRFPRNYVNQVLEYLKVSGLKLALLINFGQDQVVCKRVLNSNL